MQVKDNQSLPDPDDICNEGYILKIVNSLDSKKQSFIDAQNEMMIYLGKLNSNIHT